MPLVGKDVDLRDFGYMPLDVARLRDSELAATPNAEAFRCSVLSWCVAWHQVPAASLPDDDASLARLLGFGRDVKGWKKIRASGALRGWIKCSDGLLYHPVVAEKAIDSWDSKRKHNYGKCCDRIRKENKRREKSGLPQLGFPTFDQWNSGAYADGIPPENALKGDIRECKGDVRETLSPNPSLPEATIPSGTLPGEHALRPGLLGEIIQGWNRESGCRPVTILTPLQVANLLALTRASPAHGRVEWWIALFRRISLEMGYLQGKNDRKWKADLGWVVDVSNWANVVNGRYCNDEEVGENGARKSKGPKQGTHAHRVNTAKHDQSAAKATDY